MSDSEWTKWGTVKDRHGAPTLGEDVRVRVMRALTAKQHEAFMHADRVHVSPDLRQIAIVVVDGIGVRVWLKALGAHELEVPLEVRGWGVDGRIQNTIRQNYQGFDYGKTWIFVDLETVETTLAKSCHVVVSIEFEPGRTGNDDDAFEHYSCDEVGAAPIELRFGGEGVIEEHAYAMAWAGVRVMLAPVFVTAFVAALKRLGERVEVELLPKDPSR